MATIIRRVFRKINKKHPIKLWVFFLCKKKYFFKTAKLFDSGGGKRHNKIE